MYAMANLMCIKWIIPVRMTLNCSTSKWLLTSQDPVNICNSQWVVLYMFVRTFDFCPVSMIFQLDFRTLPAVWYALVFHFIPIYLQYLSFWMIFTFSRFVISSIWLVVYITIMICQFTHFLRFLFRFYLFLRNIFPIF